MARADGALPQRVASLRLRRRLGAGGAAPAPAHQRCGLLRRRTYEAGWRRGRSRNRYCSLLEQSEFSYALLRVVCK